MIFILSSSEDHIIFSNEGIKMQAPCLLAVVLFKYALLLKFRFKTKKSLFKINVAAYIIFLLVVISIDYKEDLKSLVGN